MRTRLERAYAAGLTGAVLIDGTPSEIVLFDDRKELALEVHALRYQNTKLREKIKVTHEAYLLLQDIPADQANAEAERVAALDF